MIAGMSYVRDYISERQEVALIRQIDEMDWSTELKRRTQQFGWRYDYKAKTVTSADYLGNLPRWAESLATKLYKDGYTDEKSDQCILNEYTPGQGIHQHIDCRPCFSNTIASVSLLSHVVIEFVNREDDSEEIGKVYRFLLEPRSLLVITGAARFKWSHGIPSIKTDVWKGQEFERTRRVSVTFRKVLDEFFQIDDPAIFEARSLGGKVDEIKDNKNG